MIPKQFAAVSIELVGKFRSISSDKENSFSILGVAEAAKVAREPYPQIPDRFELVDNSLKVAAFVCGQEPGHIFKDNPARFSD